MIRAKEVRVIGENGEQHGILSLKDALNLAQDKEVDLVEVAPTADPPVCRLLDYGKFKYEQQKKERQAHKKQTTISIRQVRLRPKTGEHDLWFKTALVKKLLDKGNKVKVLVLFRGREISHPQLGKELLDKVANALKERASVERPASIEGRSMSMILSPQTIRKPKKEQNEVAEEVADAQNENS
ncbi:MAG TPA: translation initiation factor IF-3 [Dehalococcoidia bacterium]|nr:translation initiation factor IF-3 [Dehalococcoidia bacterium]